MVPVQALQKVVALLVVWHSISTHYCYICANSHHDICVVHISASWIYCPECYHILHPKIDGENCLNAPVKSQTTILPMSLIVDLQHCLTSSFAALHGSMPV